MRTVMRWDPFGELSSLRRAMERVFNEYSVMRGRDEEEPEWTFPVDVLETEKEVTVKAVLPGIKPEDVEISVTRDSLLIKGETRHEEKVEKEDYFRQEIRWGAFSRMVPLPSVVHVDAAEAEVKDGVLTVKLPKAEEARAKTIKVRGGEPAAVR